MPPQAEAARDVVRVARMLLPQPAPPGVPGAGGEGERPCGGRTRDRHGVVAGRGRDYLPLTGGGRFVWLKLPRVGDAADKTEDLVSGIGEAVLLAWRHEHGVVSTELTLAVSAADFTAPGKDKHLVLPVVRVEWR